MFAFLAALCRALKYAALGILASGEWLLMLPLRVFGAGPGRSLMPSPPKPAATQELARARPDDAEIAIDQDRHMKKVSASIVEWCAAANASPRLTPDMPGIVRSHLRDWLKGLNSGERAILVNAGYMRLFKYLTTGDHIAGVPSMDGRKSISKPLRNLPSSPSIGDAVEMHPHTFERADAELSCGC